MGKKNHNICSKCGVRHAAPTGKACLAGAGKQAEMAIEDEIIQGGQAPNQVGLDSLCDPPYIYENQFTTSFILMIRRVKPIL